MTTIAASFSFVMTRHCSRISAQFLPKQTVNAFEYDEELYNRRNDVT